MASDAPGRFSNTSCLGLPLSKQSSPQSWWWHGKTATFLHRLQLIKDGQTTKLHYRPQTHAHDAIIKELYKGVTVLRLKLALPAVSLLASQDFILSRAACRTPTLTTAQEQQLGETSATHQFAKIR